VGHLSITVHLHTYAFGSINTGELSLEENLITVSNDEGCSRF
jgi:hypothetical protein